MLNALVLLRRGNKIIKGTRGGEGLGRKRRGVGEKREITGYQRR